MLLHREPRSLLVTGAAGFIGSAFVRWLLDHEEWSGHVVSLDALTYAGHLSKLSSILDDPRHTFVHGSILDGALLDQLQESWSFDTILHCAAETHVDRSIQGPQLFTLTNVLGTQEILEFVRRHPQIHHHQVSTDEVFGALGPTGLFHEESPYAPNSPYAASKAAADHLVTAYANTYGLSTTISYASNNYGPHQHPEKIIPLMLWNLRHREPLPLYGSGQQVRDWLYVDDHAEGLWSLLRHAPAGRRYCLGGEHECSNLSLVQNLIQLFVHHAQVAGCSPPSADELHSLTQHVADRPGHDFRYAMDTTRAREELGWSPRTPFHTALSSTVQWHLTQAIPPAKGVSFEWTSWLEQQCAFRL